MDEIKYIRVAEICKTFGLLGEVKAYSLTSFPELRFKKGAHFSLLNEKTGTRIPLTLKGARFQGDFMFLSFKEWDKIEDAETHMHEFLEMEEVNAPLPKGYFRFKDLIGCKVLDEEGKVLGEVKNLTDYAPVKNLRVAREGGKDFFVPFIDKEFILKVDLEKKEITIKVIPGLL